MFLLISSYSLCTQMGVHCNRMVALCNWIGVICTRTVALAFVVIAPGWVYIATGWLHIMLRQVYIATGQLHNLYFPSRPIPMSFAVHCIDGVDAQGHVTTVTHYPVPDSMTLAPGYAAMQEDPNIYKTTDLCGYVVPRQFPGMQLPVPGAPAPAQQASPPRSPFPAPGLVIPDHLIDVMQSMHDEQVRFLKPLGRDPCAQFREKDEERILNNLHLDVVVCLFCGRRCKNHQKLKSDCKWHHCKSVAVKCKSCNKVFGDAYALKVHMRLHSDARRVYKCHVCNKSYITRSKLNEHSKQHIESRPQCDYCNKQLADSKTLADQKKICPQCPGVADLSEEQRKPHKCPPCYRCYTHLADVCHHFKAKHPNV